MSVLDKYKISYNDFNYLQNTKEFPKTWNNILNETFFKLDKDFDILFKVLYDQHKLKLGQNNIKDMGGVVINVEALTTMYNGQCYKITSMFKEKKMLDYMRFDIEFKSQLTGYLLM